jgi:hypothetical protein
MTQVIVELPDILANLPPAERESLLRAGVHEAVQARLREIEVEIEEASARVRHFEQQYGTSFSQFETTLLPALDSFQAHEDYNDWFFWQRVLDEKQALLARFS